jgi:tetratricopeptide (TPR) repeat protein
MNSVPRTTTRLWPGLGTLALLVAGAASGAPETPERSVQELVKEHRLELAVPPGPVTVQAEPLQRRFRLEVPRLSKEQQTAASRALAKGGLTTISTRPRGERLVLEIVTPYPNLHVTARRDGKSKKLELILGPGLYLLPEAPLVPYSTRVPGLQVPNQFGEAEAAMASPDLRRAEALLLKLAKLPAPGGRIARLRLADLAALAGDMPTAARLARAALDATRQDGAGLEPLAAWRLVAYGGTLFDERLDGRLGSTPAQSPLWIREEIRFARARLELARGDLASSAEEWLALFEQHPRGAFLPAALGSATRTLLEREAALQEEKRFASASRLGLRALASLTPMDEARAESLAGPTAQALAKAGLPGQAADLILWQLKTYAPPFDAERTKLLAACLERSGHPERARKTLEYLQSNLPADVPLAEIVLLRGRVALSAGREEEAMASFREAVWERGPLVIRLEAAVRGASLLRAAGRRQEARDLLAEALRRAEQGPEKILADARMLSADIHYELGEMTQAAARYQAFLRDYPGDPRTAAARYRLARITKKSPVERSALQASDDCWHLATARTRRWPVVAGVQGDKR